MFEKISLDKFRPQTFETREIGTVIEVKKAIATIVGLPFCLYGQMVHFPNDLAGMVVGFDEEKVMALVLGDETQLKSGDEVIGKAEPFQVPVGERFVGRIVDALGNACDGRGKVEAEDAYPVFRVAPGVMERVRLSDQLYTGTKIIDAIIPIAKGQRELIVGARMNVLPVIRSPTSSARWPLALGMIASMILVPVYNWSESRTSTITPGATRRARSS